MNEVESESKVELGFAGTGGKLVASTGIALGGGTLMAAAIGMGIYPETITIAGKIINMRDPILIGYIGAGAAWLINTVKLYVLRHRGD